MSVCYLKRNKLTRRSHFEDAYGNRLSKNFSDKYSVRKFGDAIRAQRTSPLEEIVYVETANALYMIGTSISPLREGLFEVRRGNGKVYLYDEKGKLLNSEFEDVYTSDFGYLHAKKNGKWGIVNAAFNWILQPEYDEIMDFNEFGYYVIDDKELEEVRIMDLSGRIVLTIKNCSHAYFLTSRLIMVCLGDVCGIVDVISGKTIIKAKYTEIQFDKGFFKVYRNGCYGLYNIHGEQVMECKYKKIVEVEDKFVGEMTVRIEIPKENI